MFGARSLTLLVTLNGGAVALMLGLIAKSSESGTEFSKLVKTFSPSLSWFSADLVLAFCAARFAYRNAAAGEFASLCASERYQWLKGDPMTEAFNRINRCRPWVQRFAYAAVGSAILSLACFLVGIYSGLSVDRPVT